MLTKAGHSVIGTKRLEQSETNNTEVTIKPWDNALDPVPGVDLVIHLAGIYRTKYEQSAVRDCFESNVGLASTIANIQMKTKVPIIAFGSFFEKAPAHLQPWSYYAISKTAALNILKESAIKSNSKLVYLYLYDTYGASKSRQKFVDLILEAIEDNKALDASPGLQIQDLSHVDDVVKAIIHVVDSLDTFKIGIHEFQVRSREVVTLQQLANLAATQSNRALTINWGKYPYRDREVFELWDCAEDLPNWRSVKSLETFFFEYFETIFEGHYFG
jgi:nucleoside-diphosphate-sugar epimerase